MTLIYPHIPKTAGTSFLGILEQVYPPSSTFRTFRGSSENMIREFIDLPDAEKSRYALVCGHMNFGLHEYIPGPSTYVTFVRDPIQRVISDYSWIKRNPDHFLHDDCVSMSLRVFVESKITTEIDNGQTRVLAGIANVPPILCPLGDSVPDIPFGGCGLDVLEQAKRNLDRMAVVGLVESFNQSLLLMRQVLRWNMMPSRISLNVDPRREAKQMIDPETLELIRSVNFLDLELYRHAQALTERLLVSEQYDSCSTL